eukprot:tig00020912_g15830.t1
MLANDTRSRPGQEPIELAPPGSPALNRTRGAITPVGNEDAPLIFTSKPSRNPLAQERKQKAIMDACAPGLAGRLHSLISFLF